MKTLIVYYSLDGNVKLLSETMAQEIEADLLALHLKKELKTSGLMKYFWGGRQVVIKELPELEPLTVNLANYDFIIIGTPVWVGNFTPAIRSFLHNYSLANKKIALFCSHESTPAKCLINLEAELAANSIIATTDFFAPLKKDKIATLERATAWARSLV